MRQWLALSPHSHEVLGSTGWSWWGYSCIWSQTMVWKQKSVVFRQWQHLVLVQTAVMHTWTYHLAPPGYRDWLKTKSKSTLSGVRVHICNTAFMSLEWLKVEWRCQQKPKSLEAWDRWQYNKTEISKWLAPLYCLALGLPSIWWCCCLTAGSDRT